MASTSVGERPHVSAGRPAIVIGGPTASGKTALALALARTFGGALVNADSMQLYRDIPILSAAPAPADLVDIPHALFGTADAAERIGVGRWLASAEEAIAQFRADGLVPIVVGGTGLFLRALMQGLAPVPEIPATVRARIARRLDQEGLPALRADLVRLDPEGAATIRPGDTHRILRALEVVSATEMTLSAWQRRRGGAAATADRHALIALVPPRAALDAAIETRFRAMIEAGALTEVRRLADRGLAPGLPAMKALGVRELAAVLRGETTVEGAVAAAVRATGQYAKRQGTWFRHQFVPRLGTADRYWRRDAKFSESFREEIFLFIRQFLLTPAV